MATPDRVVVVGGGAAGLMAAATIVEERPGAAVTLLERNPRLGAKVIISGGGRCNVTTGVTDVREVLTRYPRGAWWLRHAMHSFPPEQVMAWFEDHGVPLKTEADLRVFPVSDNGRDIVAAFERIFAGGRVDVRLGATATSVARNERGFWVEVAQRVRDTGMRSAGSQGEAAPISGNAGRWGPFSALILTTGGSAFRHTGSTGDGYRFARALGHTVTPLYPSLNAYVVREPWAKAISGLSFADAALEIPARSAPGAKHTGPYRFRGPFLFTHFGVTGPAVFALCSLAATERYGADEPMPLRINLLPDRNAEQIDALLRQRFADLGGRRAVNALDTLLPRSICPVLCDLARIDPATPAAQIGRAARGRLAGLIGVLPLTIVGRRNGEEFVTAGGVCADEVDPRNMESKLVPGLFLAGEILDVDGFTGGYNLQAAWCTGRLAGLSASHG